MASVANLNRVSIAAPMIAVRSGWLNRRGMRQLVTRLDDVQREMRRSSVAERGSHTPEVAGSNPAVRNSRWPLFGWEAMRWRYVPMHTIGMLTLIGYLWLSR